MKRFLHLFGMRKATQITYATSFAHHFQYKPIRCKGIIVLYHYKVKYRDRVRPYRGVKIFSIHNHHPHSHNEERQNHPQPPAKIDHPSDATTAQQPANVGTIARFVWRQAVATLAPHGGLSIPLARLELSLSAGPNHSSPEQVCMRMIIFFATKKHREIQKNGFLSVQQKSELTQNSERISPGVAAPQPLQMECV